MMKMKLYNGSFSSVEDQARKNSVITIQFMGEGMWLFQIVHSYTVCSEVNCRVGTHCRKKPKIVEFVVEEDKAFETEFSVCKALSHFGRLDLASQMGSRAVDREVVSTVLKVDKARQGSFVFTTRRPRMVEGRVAWELIYTNKFHFGSEDSRTLINTMTMTSTASVPVDLFLGGTAVELTESQG